MLVTIDVLGGEEDDELFVKTTVSTMKDPSNKAPPKDAISHIEPEPQVIPITL